MNRQPLVTIGVISYNNSRFVVEALDSIKNQTYQNIQIIISDDCSTDDSVLVIENWMKENSHLNMVIFTTSVNGGVCKSLNKIVQHSQGKYISTISTDDKYLPNFVRNRVEYLERADDQTGICYSKSNLIDEQSVFIEEESRDVWLTGNVFENLCKMSNSFCKPLTMMVKKEVYSTVGIYDENLIFEDLDFLFRVSRIYKIDFIDNIDTEYRIVTNSLGTKLLTTPRGLESYAAVIKKNIGHSTMGDFYLAKRLRKISLKKKEIGLSSWYPDFKLSVKYSKSVRDTLIMCLFYPKHILTNKG